MKFDKALGFALLSAVVLTSSAFGAEAKVESLRVFPAEVNLRTSRDRQLIVVQAVYSDGLTRDVSRKARWTLANPSLIRREGETLWPAVDGRTELTIEFEGQKATLPVVVEQAARQRDISFKLDIMPIFMKAGCNSGSCHGAARGKDGFRLSLFGYDPDGDHFRLTRELGGRRIDLAVPTASLTVEKATGAVPHTGGKRFEPQSELCQELVRWIAAGCPTDALDVPKVTGLEIYPRQAVLNGEGETQQVTVLAKYFDGTDRDVTNQALFLSNNDNSAVINDRGVVTAGKRGEAYIMARFSTYTVGSQYIVLPKGLQFQATSVPAANYVDELINQKLKKLRLTSSPVCSDEVFVRRVYLDLLGILPTVEEYQRFMTSTAADKRDKLIDELLNRKEFTEVWVGYWAEWLMVRSSNQISYKATLLYYNWLADQVGKNVPLDQMVRNLLGANGGTFKVPATNYYQNETDTLKVSENVAQ